MSMHVEGCRAELALLEGRLRQVITIASELITGLFVTPGRMQSLNYFGQRQKGAASPRVWLSAPLFSHLLDPKGRSGIAGRAGATASEALRRALAWPPQP